MRFASVAQATLSASKRRISSTRRPRGDRNGEARRLTFVLRRSPAAEPLLRTIEEKLHRPIWNEYHLGAAYVALERLEITAEESSQWGTVIRALVQKTQMMAEDRAIDARGLANIMWATAKLKDKLPEFADSLPVLLECFPHFVQAEQLNAQELSNVLWAVATMHLCKEKVAPVMQKVLDQLMTAPETFIEQHLSNILWSAATMQLEKASIEPIAAAVIRRLGQSSHSFNEQALSNILWASATLQFRDGEVRTIVAAVAERATKAPHRFNQQEVSNVLWAAATLANRRRARW